MDPSAGYRPRLPSGFAICASLPDILYLPELVFGGLVWILVACTYIYPVNPQAWVMAVSIFCFIMTFIWMFVFLCGSHNDRYAWAAADVFYHFIATVLYLGASVPLAEVTLFMSNYNATLVYYQMDISAVVFAYITTLLYFVHTVFSAIRWKSF
ncbi:myelin and lymphocyte protein-like [Denticeps clupeoides]|uniref:MARVEL domain-containing protein n=1 Tax=Denticeps clupeoides TaxID=299321 RepID=A0AAY4AI90_9TELE|nr:myelin and lymphocyte protein-like [Denticeps clupeoides]